MWTRVPAPIPSAAMMPSRRPPRAALAMTKVMSAPGTMFSARPAATKARNTGSGGRSSMPATLSISEVVVDFAAASHVCGRRLGLDLGRPLGLQHAFPARDDARRHSIADDVCPGSPHVEEMVDGEDQQQARLGNLEHR